MKMNELLANLPTELLVEFTGRAAGQAHNPAVVWVSHILMNELRRRRGEPEQPVAPLNLQPDEIDFALEWLNFAAAHNIEIGIGYEHDGLALLGAFLDYVRALVENSVSTIHD